MFRFLNVVEEVMSLIDVHVLHRLVVRTSWLGSDGADMVEGDIRLVRFPRTFRLERTNFTLKWRQKSRPSVQSVIEVLHNKIEAVKLDVVNFRSGDCVVSSRSLRLPSLMITSFLCE